MPAPGPLPPAAASAPFQALVAPCAPAFAELESFLADEVAGFEPLVQPMVEYCLSHSGKKLRPLLVFTLSVDDGQPAGPDIIRAAAIVELVHLATLVHDDILDRADLRHRTATVTARFGPHAAVLLGDALFAHALHLAAQYPTAAVCREVARATRQVCSGEIAQTLADGRNPSLAHYFRVIDLKTAELFRVSAWLGAFLAGMAPEGIHAACRYARHLGIAYQIYDDAADLFAEEATAGKTLGTDLATGKFTLPVLLWLEALPEHERQRQQAALRKGALPHGALPPLLRQSGVLERVHQAFRRELDAAAGAVAGIPVPLRQPRLVQLLDFVAAAWNKFSIP